MGLFDFGKKNRSNYRNNVSPMEKYIREEERWHAWECPHGDSYDCDHDDCY